MKTSPQNTTWPDMLAVRQAADDYELFESASTFDHFYPIPGPGHLRLPDDGTRRHWWTKRGHSERLVWAWASSICRPHRARQSLSR